jgi:hypothetical protein
MSGEMTALSTLPYPLPVERLPLNGLLLEQRLHLGRDQEACRVQASEPELTAPSRDRRRCASAGGMLFRTRLGKGCVAGAAFLRG